MKRNMPVRVAASRVNWLKETSMTICIPAWLQRWVDEESRQPFNAALE